MTELNEDKIELIVNEINKTIRELRGIKKALVQIIEDERAEQTEPQTEQDEVHNPCDYCKFYDGVNCYNPQTDCSRK